MAPPSFEELVADSEFIARAQVVKVEARWVTESEGKVIKTFVTFSLDKVLKGKPGAELTLSFLGGEVDGEGMVIHGMPTFAVGDADVLFVSDRKSLRFCPLVAMMHGRYPVRVDQATGRAYVMRNDGSPLESKSDVELPHASGLAAGRPRSMSRAMEVARFEEEILRAVSLAAQPRPATQP